MWGQPIGDRPCTIQRDLWHVTEVCPAAGKSPGYMEMYMRDSLCSRQSVVLPDGNSCRFLRRRYRGRSDSDCTHERPGQPVRKIKKGVMVLNRENDQVGTAALFTSYRDGDFSITA